MPLSEKALANKKEYIKEYTKENIRRVPLNVQKSKYDEIKKASAEAGETVSGYIKKAIDNRLYGMDNKN